MTSTGWRWTAGGFFLAAAWACSSAKVKPDDMSVKQHEQLAHQEDGEAAVHAKAYDPSAEATRGSGAMDTGVTYNPTASQQASAQEHQRHAAQHRAAAQALRSFEDAQCLGVPPETRDACPFLGGNVARVENIHGGVRLVPPAGTSPDALWHVIACHAAFSRSQHQTTVEDCAPYVPLATVRKSADGKSVELTTEVAASVAELQRRAADQVLPPTG